MFILARLGPTSYCIRRPLPSAPLSVWHLHVPAACHFDSLTVHIREKRRANGQHSAGSLGGRARSSEGNVLVRVRLATLPVSDLFTRDAQGDTLAVGGGDESARLLCAGQASVNVAKGDSVGTDAELQKAGSH